ncbi:MAG: hypothetical protein AAFR87_23540 [Bacteroidota bacterium]
MKIIVMCFLLISSLSMSAQQSIAGIWNTGKENTKIEITEVDGLYQGKILSSDNDKAKIGKLILKDIKSVRKGYKGKLFAAQKGEWMNAELKEKDNKLSITVSAGFMSKTVEWFKE